MKHYRAALALAKNDPDLQQTVEELERAVEPPKPVASADGLSLAQIESEFLQFTPPPAPPPKPAPPPIPVLEPPPAPSLLWSEPAASGQDSAERALATRRILALEHWLDAIHVTRAQPRP